MIIKAGTETIAARGVFSERYLMQTEAASPETAEVQNEYPALRIETEAPMTEAQVQALTASDWLICGDDGTLEGTQSGYTTPVRYTAAFAKISDAETQLAEAEAELAALNASRNEEAETARTLARSLLDTAALSDDEAYAYRSLYDEWSGERDYTAGERLTYAGRFWKCLQSHPAQSIYPPDQAVSLFVEIPDPHQDFPLWRAPLGSHDAYPLGAQVTHNGQHWRSDLDVNVWEPGVFGWTLIEEVEEVSA